MDLRYLKHFSKARHDNEHIAGELWQIEVEEGFKTVEGEKSLKSNDKWKNIYLCLKLF